MKTVFYFTVGLLVMCWELPKMLIEGFIRDGKKALGHDR